MGNTNSQGEGLPADFSAAAPLNEVAAAQLSDAAKRPKKLSTTDTIDRAAIIRDVRLEGRSDTLRGLQRAERCAQLAITLSTHIHIGDSLYSSSSDDYR